MPYAGKILQPREIVDLVAEIEAWKTQKVIATAVALAESKGSIGAWHDNFGEDGVTLLSRDCGIYQDNIGASDVGTEVEAALRTDSFDPEEYMLVARQNVAHAAMLYNAAWTRDGKPDKRHWQPWVAFTTGWATFPEWWVWKQTDGVPTGPWTATGQYVHKAIRAVANWHLLIKGDMGEQQAIAEGERLREMFGVVGTLAHNPRKAVYWDTFPTQPTSPPADGVGPRPVPNDGRLPHLSI